MAFTVGLLVFLAIDATLEGIDLAGQGSQAFGGSSLVFLGAALAFLAAVRASRWMRTPQARGQGRRRGGTWR